MLGAVIKMECSVAFGDNYSEWQHKIGGAILNSSCPASSITRLMTGHTP